MPNCERVGVDFIDRAAVVGRTELTVRASPALVWQVLNETDRWPEWFDGMKEARVTSAAWDGVGSTRFVKVGPLAVDEEVIAWEPERRWGFCATGMNATGWIAKRMVETIDIRAEGSGSHLTYTGALDPVPWLRPVGGLIKKQMLGAWSTSLANLDRHLDL